MIADNSNNGGNNGNRGKFSDRLKKIRLDRLKKRKTISSVKEEKLNFKNTSRNIFKMILCIPSVVCNNVINKSRVKGVVEDNKTKQSESVYQNSSSQRNDNKKIVSDFEIRKKVEKIKNIDVSLLQQKVNETEISDNFKQNDEIKETKNKNKNELKKIKLQKQIVNLIKKKLVKNINELEILYSEFYVLNELKTDAIYLDKCQEYVKEIKKLLSKVKVLKEKYDLLKENVDFEYMLEYGDDFLIDKILELKDLCSRDDIRQTVDDYKILEVYQFLYLKIDKLQDETIKLQESKKNKVEKLKQRDIDFDKLIENIYDLDLENDRYKNFVNSQELLLNDLNDKVSRIDSYESVTYRLKGFGQLLGNSFKYLGLLLANPLKGLVPGIVTQTLITKNLVHNLYNALDWEESRKIVYEAIDYSTSIDFAINNLDDMSSLVDSTLEDIVKLKDKYKKEFSKYETAFSDYQEAIKKINKIENAVLGNKIKIETMRYRMKENKKENNSKLMMVKKLNDTKKD